MVAQPEFVEKLSVLVLKKPFLSHGRHPLQPGSATGRWHERRKYLLRELILSAVHISLELSLTAGASAATCVDALTFLFTLHWIFAPSEQIVDSRTHASAIYVFSMPDPYYQHGENIVLNFADDAVLPYTIAPEPNAVAC
jgi:hypothetical protein